MSVGECVWPNCLRVDTNLKPWEGQHRPLCPRHASMAASQDAQTKAQADQGALFDTGVGAPEPLGREPARRSKTATQRTNEAMERAAEEHRRRREEGDR